MGWNSLWLRFKEHRRQRRLLNKWRALCRRDRLRQIPLDLALRSLLRNMAGYEVGRPARTAWCRGLLRPWKLISGKIANANDESASPIPPRSNPPAWRVLLKRRLVLWLLCRGLKALRLFLGLLMNSKRPASCSSIVVRARRS